MTRNYEVISDKFNVMLLCTSGSYAHNWNNRTTQDNVVPLLN